MFSKVCANDFRSSTHSVFAGIIVVLIEEATKSCRRTKLSAIDAMSYHNASLLRRAAVLSSMYKDCDISTLYACIWPLNLTNIPGKMSQGKYRYFAIWGAYFCLYFLMDRVVVACRLPAIHLEELLTLTRNLRSESIFNSFSSDQHSKWYSGCFSLASYQQRNWRLTSYRVIRQDGLRPVRRQASHYKRKTL